MKLNIFVTDRTFRDPDKTTFVRLLQTVMNQNHMENIAMNIYNIILALRFVVQSQGNDLT